MSRRLDHVVLAARDLETQAEVFRHMGFRVGARNAHPWGTQIDLRARTVSRAS